MPFDAVGQLATEPGGAALSDLVDRVAAIDPTAVTSVVVGLRAAGDGVESSMRALGRGGAGIADEWHGPGADAYATYLGSMTRAGRRTRASAHQAADTLERVRPMVQALHDEVAGHVSEALDAAAAARARAATVGPAPGVADAWAAEAMAGPTVAAQRAVQRVETELARVAGVLSAVADGMTDFAALPAVGTTSVSASWAPRVGGSTADGPGPSAIPRLHGIRAEVTIHPPGTGGDAPTSPPGALGGHGPVGGHGALGHGALSELPGVHPVPPGPPVPSGPPGRVGDWIHQATAVLASHGVPVDRMNPDDIATIIDRESGGNPNAVNGWDSNASHGTPSQGLMQTIGPTFAAYKLPGHDDIHDPIDNIIAGVRYAIARYGSVSHVPGVVALSHGHAYVGY